VRVIKPRTGEHGCRTPDEALAVIRSMASKWSDEHIAATLNHYSPIEPCWSKLKTCLRALKARTREALDSALAHAIDTISATDARGWFNHCGYAVH
jgi:hypothetical protein